MNPVLLSRLVYLRRTDQEGNQKTEQADKQSVLKGDVPGSAPQDDDCRHGQHRREKQDRKKVHNARNGRDRVRILFVRKFEKDSCGDTYKLPYNERGGSLPSLAARRRPRYWRAGQAGAAGPRRAITRRV